MVADVQCFDVYLVNLDPTLGSEIKKTRPCLFISPDEMNRHIQTVIIAPMTSARRDYPSRVDITFQRKKGPGRTRPDSDGRQGASCPASWAPAGDALS